MNYKTILATAFLCSQYSAVAALGFTKQDCTVYGNLVEETDNKHVYDNHYVHYKLNFDQQGIVEQLELRFDKGERPSLNTMLSCMPNPVSKDRTNWGNRAISNNGKTITLQSENGKYLATIEKERWNRPASVTGSPR